MVGSVASTIQGESNGTPASMFAVATTIYNRQQAGTFPGGRDLNSIVNAPNQYIGGATPSAQALQFADAVQNGTLSNYGTVGNAVNFQTAGSNTTLGSNPNAAVIGGNAFSDRFGTPTNNFVPPAYGQNPGLAGLGDPNLAQINDPAYQTGMPTYGDISASDTTGLPYGDSTSQLQAMGYSPSQIAQLQQEGYYGGALHVNVTPTNTAATVGGSSAPGNLTNTGVLQGASGAGQPVQLNLGSGTVADISKWVTAPITAAEQELAAGLQSLGNWFSRGFLIILGIVIILVALWKVSGSPSPAVIMEAA